MNSSVTTYRFVGVAASIGHRDLTQFGQKLTLSQADAEEAIRGGAALIPESDFESAAFTADELKRFSFAGTQSRAPQSFREKRDLVLARFRSLQGSLLCR